MRNFSTLKTIIFTFLLLFVFLPEGIAQEKRKQKKEKKQLFNIASKVDTIVLDFQTKQFVKGFSKLDSIKNSGHLYQLIIKNLNTNLYQVSIGKKDSIRSESGITQDIFSLLNVDNLGKLIAQIPVIESVIENNKAEVQDLTKQSQELKRQLSSNSNLPSLDIIHNAEAQRIQDNLELYDEISFYLEQIKKQQDAILGLNETIDRLKSDVHYYQIISQIEDVNSPIRDIIPNSFNNLEDFVRSIQSLSTKIVEVKKEVDENFFDYQSKLAPKIINTEADSLLKQHKLIDSTYKTQSLALESLGKSTDSETLKKLLQFIVNIKNNSKNEYRSLPLQFNGDYGELKISITPRDSVGSLQKYETSIGLPWTKKRNFWALSIGAYHSSAVHDKDFVISTGENGFEIIEENTGGFEVGANAMIKVGNMFGKSSIGWHFGIGTGVSIGDELKPRVMFGGGPAFGKGNNKLFLDMGVMLGSIDDISNLYEKNTIYNAKPENIKVSRNKAGFFLSLNYSILGK